MCVKTLTASVFTNNTDFNSLHNFLQKYRYIERPLDTRVTVPRFTGKTRITGKTAEIPERPKNNGETLNW